MRRFVVSVLFGLTIAVTGLPSIAHAADDPAVEVGTSLVSLVAGLGSNDTTIIGIPNSTFGFGTPGVYASFFAGPQLAIEPQLALSYVSTGQNRSSHLLSLNGQVDYFVEGLRRPSAYVFASLGVANATGSTNPVNVGLGIGYRIPAGGRLSFRLDARFQHFTDGIGNTVGLGFSLGGLFGSR